MGDYSLEQLVEGLRCVDDASVEGKKFFALDDAA